MYMFASKINLLANTNRLKHLPRLLVLEFFCFGIVACGGGDSTTAAATEPVSTGVHIDSTVEGLQYETAHTVRL
jgi:hypothetical protein